MRYTYFVNCLTCGQAVAPKPIGTRGKQAQYCADSCRPSYKPRAEKYEDCLACGERLVPSATGRNKRYCNRVCSDQARQTKVKASRQRLVKCQECGVEFLDARKARRYCSHECRYVANLRDKAQQTKEKYAVLYPGGIKVKICRWCNQEMQVSASKSYAGRLYHEACSKEAQSARYRIKTVKRQKKTNPYRISHEQVVREYGSDCHICREPIDLSLPRTHRFGLTVDHLVPINKGGTDDMANLRPAHWICNVKKSDKMPETNDA